VKKKFKELARCYEILSNDEERKKYDMSDFNEQYNQQSSTSHFENFNFNDIFNTFFGSGSSNDGNTFFRFSGGGGGGSGSENFGFGGFPGFNTFNQNPRSHQHQHQQQHQQQPRSSHGHFQQQHQQQQHQQQPKTNKEIVYITLKELMSDNVKYVTTKDKKNIELKIPKGIPNNHILKKDNYEFEIRIKNDDKKTSSMMNNFVRGEKSHKSDLYYSYPLKLEDFLLQNIKVDFKNIDDEEISFFIDDISQLNYDDYGILQYKIKNKGLPYFKSENDETRGHLYVQFHIIYPVLNEKQKKNIPKYSC